MWTAHHQPVHQQSVTVSTSVIIMTNVKPSTGTRLSQYEVDVGPTSVRPLDHGTADPVYNTSSLTDHLTVMVHALVYPFHRIGSV